MKARLPQGYGKQSQQQLMQQVQQMQENMRLKQEELENTEYIDGHRIAKEAGIKFGLFTEEGNIWDYYPYWHNWISFTLEAGAVVRTPEKYANFL